MNNNINLSRLIFSFFIFCLSIIVIYVIIKIFISPDRFNYYIKYFLVFLTILFILFGFRIFGSQKIISNLNVIIFTSIILIYILEIISFNIIIQESNYQFNKNKKAAKKLNLTFDERTAEDVYKDLKNKSLNPKLPYARHIFKSDDKTIQTFGTISNSLMILCNESGKWITFKSDRYGFNNPDDLWEKNSIEILVVGDSYVQGHCVKSSVNYRGNLETLSKKNVLSLGVAGMGTLNEFAMFKEYGLKIKPKKVVLIYMNNDLDNLFPEKKNKILMEYLNNPFFTQNLINKQDLIDYNTEKAMLNSNILTGDFKLNRFIKFFHLRSFLKEKIKNLTDPDSNTSSSKNIYKRRAKNLPIFYDIIFKFNKLVNGYGGEFYVFIIPAAGEFHGSEKEKKDNKKLRLEIYEQLIKNNINVFDVHKNVFLNLQNPLDVLPFGDKVKHENHFNELGFELSSKYIYEKIK